MLQSAPPTGPRAMSSLTRGRGGGISKRGSRAAPRRDKDGDLDMDATGARGRGGPRGGARGGPRGGPRLPPTVRHPRPAHKGTSLGLVDVKVLGWGSTEGERETAIEFLENKANVKVKKSRTVGKLLILSVPNGQVQQLVALDNTKYNGKDLSIKAPNHVQLDAETAEKKAFADATPQSKDTKATIELLGQVLESRYNAQAKYLDLSRLGDDPLLRQGGFFDLSSTTSKMFPALMLVADRKFKSKQEKREAIETVNLAFNNLTDIHPVTPLSLHFPDIKNLSLEGNKLTTWKDIDAWKTRFRDLEQLVLIGNPIQSVENYAQELARRYPKLIMLDNVVLDRAKIGLPTTLPTVSNPEPKATGIVKSHQGLQGSAVPIKGNFILDEQNVGTQFLATFFGMYDNQKDQLLAQYYDANSIFTVSANTLAPRVEQPGVSIPPKPWEVYYAVSRNLSRVHNAETQKSKFFQGVDAIRKCWDQLPKTRHDTTAAEKWVYDIFPIHHLPDPNNPSNIQGVGGMIILLHGEFDETEKVTRGRNSGLKRSFDRTFTIGPGNTPSGIRIINDMLVIRPYGGIEAWKPTDGSAMPVAQPAAPAPTVIPGVTPGMSVEQLNAAKLAELQKRTGLNDQFARECMEIAGWDFDDAMRRFEEANRGGLIPGTAFLS